MFKKLPHPGIFVSVTSEAWSCAEEMKLLAVLRNKHVWCHIPTPVKIPESPTSHSIRHRIIQYYLPMKGPI